jgi:hypothetical protein
MRAIHHGPLLFGGWRPRRRGRLKLEHWNMPERLVLAGIVLLVAVLVVGLWF